MKESGKTSDQLPGTLDMRLVKTLAHWPLDGYCVAESIHEGYGDTLRLREGTL